MKNFKFGKITAVLLCLELAFPFPISFSAEPVETTGVSVVPVISPSDVVVDDAAESTAPSPADRFSSDTPLVEIADEESPEKKLSVSVTENNSVVSVIDADGNIVFSFSYGEEIFGKSPVQKALIVQNEKHSVLVVDLAINRVDVFRIGVDQNPHRFDGLAVKGAAIKGNGLTLRIYDWQGELPVERIYRENLKTGKLLNFQTRVVTEYENQFSPELTVTGAEESYEPGDSVKLTLTATDQDPFDKVKIGIDELYFTIPGDGRRHTINVARYSFDPETGIFMWNLDQDLDADYNYFVRFSAASTSPFGYGGVNIELIEIDVREKKFTEADLERLIRTELLPDAERLMIEFVKTPENLVAATVVEASGTSENAHLFIYDSVRGSSGDPVERMHFKTGEQASSFAGRIFGVTIDDTGAVVMIRRGFPSSEFRTRLDIFEIGTADPLRTIYYNPICTPGRGCQEDPNAVKIIDESGPTISAEIYPHEGAAPAGTRIVLSGGDTGVQVLSEDKLFIPKDIFEALPRTSSNPNFVIEEKVNYPVGGLSYLINDHIYSLDGRLITAFIKNLTFSVATSSLSIKSLDTPDASPDGKYLMHAYESWCTRASTGCALTQNIEVRNAAEGTKLTVIRLQDQDKVIAADFVDGEEHVIRVTYQSGEIEFYDASNGELIPPPVPEGWTRAASDPNSAFRVIDNAVDSQARDLQHLNLVTGKVSTIATHRKGRDEIVFLPQGILHGQPDKTPDGSIIYETARQGVEYGTNKTTYSRTVHIVELENPSNQLDFTSYYSYQPLTGTSISDIKLLGGDNILLIQTYTTSKIVNTRTMEFLISDQQNPDFALTKVGGGDIQTLRLHHLKSGRHQDLVTTNLGQTGGSIGTVYDVSSRGAAGGPVVVYALHFVNLANPLDSHSEVIVQRVDQDTGDLKGNPLKLTVTGSRQDIPLQKIEYEYPSVKVLVLRFGSLQNPNYDEWTTNIYIDLKTLKEIPSPRIRYKALEFYGGSFPSGAKRIVWRSLVDADGNKQWRLSVYFKEGGTLSKQYLYFTETADHFFTLRRVKSWDSSGALVNSLLRYDAAGMLTEIVNRDQDKNLLSRIFVRRPEGEAAYYEIITASGKTENLGAVSSLSLYDLLLKARVVE